MDRIWALPNWATAVNALLGAAALLQALGGAGLHAAPLYLPAVFLTGLWGGTGPGVAMALGAVLAENLVATLGPAAEPLGLAYANDLLFLGVALIHGQLGAILRRSHNRHRRAAEAGQVLVRLTRATGDPTQLPFLLKAIVDTGPPLLGGDYAATFSWHERLGRFVPEQQTSGAGVSLAEVTLPIGSPPLSRLLDRSNVFLTDETVEGRSLLAAARLRPLRRALFLPAVSWGRVVGCLLIGDRSSPRAFAPEEVEVGAMLTTQMAVAMENAASFQAIQDRAMEVARLLQLSNALNSQLDLDAILREVAEGAAAIAHAAEAAVGLVEGEYVVFRERVSGRPAEKRPLAEVLAAEGGAQGAGHYTLVIRDPQEEPLGALELRMRPGQAARAWDHGNGSSIPAPLTPSAERLLRVFANQAAIAIQNGRLYDSLRRQHARLQELEKLREDMTHMIVHDLRTPLTGILGSLQMMEGGMAGELPPTASNLNQLALRSARALLGLINDLLDISKLESGTFALDRTAVAPAELVEEAVQQVQPLVRERRLSLRTELPPDLPAVWVDTDLATRILVNLLGNAIKFTPGGGEIAVSADRLGERSIAFAVRDTGEGIPPEYQGMIFEKFGQVHSSRSGRKHSTGLGLTFCKMAVEAHGGQITVESSPGAGSTFTFTLPVHSGAGRPQHRPEGALTRD